MSISPLEDNSFSITPTRSGVRDINTHRLIADAYHFCLTIACIISFIQQLSCGFRVLVGRCQHEEPSVAVNVDDTMTYMNRIKSVD